MKRLKRIVCIISALVFASAALTGCGNKEKTLCEKYESYFPIGAALSEDSLDAYKGDGILEEFNSITCENEMKWSALQPSLGTFNFTAADAMVRFAKENGMKVRGHALVWHNPKAMPNHVFENAAGGPADKETVLERMRAHIGTVIRHFGGDVYCWDVVNEVIDDNAAPLNEEKSNIYRTSRWYEICGRDFIAEAFRAARAAADEAGLSGLKLFYNDYSLADPVKREKTLEMLKWLKAEGVPIDGVGMQSHYHLGSFSMAEFEKSILEYAALGLEVQITELDVNVYDETSANATNPEKFYTDGLPESIEAIQTTVYDRLMQIVRKHKDKITGVTFWGVADDLTWLDAEPVLNRKNYPYVFGMNHEKKSSYFAITDF